MLLRTRHWDGLNVLKEFIRKVNHIRLGGSYRFVKDFSLPTSCLLGV